MKRIGNKGFTLVEMLITISIISVIAIVVGVGADSMLENTDYSQYRSKFKDIFKAANIYFEIHNTGYTNSTISFNDLVSSGLLDRGIYEEINPYYEAKTNFKSSDSIKITITSGKKSSQYNSTNSNSECILTWENIDKYTNWGNC